MGNLVIIGIPVYKTTLNEFEKISLQQVKNILGRYPISFIAPQALEFDYGDEYKDFKINRFPDKYFLNTSSYSQLLLSKEFYQRFSEYQFLLIYQLDAFVFSDCLEEFCRLDYDYIGAPVPKVCWPHLDTVVGNGGLSLRKIKSAINVLEKKESLYVDPFLESEFNKAEDMFFAFCSTKQELGFSAPLIQEAFSFSMEHDVYHCFRSLNKQLPFGCHGWYRTHFDVWKPYIEAYGYQLDKFAGENHGRAIVERKKRNACKYLSKRIIRAGNVEFLKSIIEDVISIKQEYRIWGAGEDGKRCLSLLKKANVKVECIYDSSVNENQFLSGIVMRKPVDNEIKEKQSIIIIATKIYEREIKNKLESMGLKRGIDFLLFDEIEQAIVKAYYIDA